MRFIQTVFDIHHTFVPSISVSYGQSSDLCEFFQERPMKRFEHYPSAAASVSDLYNAVLTSDERSYVAVASHFLESPKGEVAFI